MNVDPAPTNSVFIANADVVAGANSPSQATGAARNGFTLLELLLAMAVFAAIAAVVIPLSAGLLGDQELTHAADQIRSEIIGARNRSMREGQVVVLRCSAGSSTLTLDVLTQSLDAISGDQVGQTSALLSGASQETIANPSEPGSETPNSFEIPESTYIETVVTSPAGGGNTVEAATLNTSTTGGTETDLPPIYFYPDGRTSNAILVVAAGKKADTIENAQPALRLQVRLNGLTGDVEAR